MFISEAKSTGVIIVKYVLIVISVYEMILELSLYLGNFLIQVSLLTKGGGILEDIDMMSVLQMLVFCGASIMYLAKTAS